MDQIPTLDVKGLSEKEEDLQQLAAQLKDAFTNIGFVAITNHNIATEVVSEAWKKVDSFFALPTEIKTEYKGDYPKKLGWTPVGNETLYNTGQDPVPIAGDYKESLDVFTNGHKFDWPNEVPQIKEVVHSLNDEFMKMSTYIFKLLAIALDLQDRDFFVKCHNPRSSKSLAVLRFVQYPPIPKGGLAKSQMRCGQHTDFGTITLLIQDENGGLEVKKRDGSWIKVTPPVGTIIVNIGDMMQRWTSDTFISNFHRVREPEEEHLKQRTRRSVVYFLNPDNDTMVECFNNSKKYQPISAFGYLCQRVDNMKIG